MTATPPQQVPGGWLTECHPCAWELWAGQRTTVERAHHQHNKKHHKEDTP